MDIWCREGQRGPKGVIGILIWGYLLMSCSFRGVEWAEGGSRGSRGVERGNEGRGGPRGGLVGQ